MKKKTMTVPLLSVIVPFYNVEQYWQRCLASLSDQPYDRRVEYILVDDGSTDGSASIAQRYCLERPEQFRIIHQENRGSGAARNAALRQAKGRYVGFADADDWIEPGMFTRMLDTALHRNADVVLCDVYKVSVSGRKRRISYMHTGEGGVDPAADKTFVFASGFSPWNKLIDKTLFLHNDLFFAEGILHQDLAVLPAVLSRSGKIVNVSEPLYNHVVRPGSSVRLWSDKVYDIFKALDRLKAVLPSRYDDEMEYLTIRELFYHVLPEHYRPDASFRRFFEAAVSRFLADYPLWQDNPYVRESGLPHRLYLQLISGNRVWPVALASRYKRLRERR